MKRSLVILMVVETGTNPLLHSIAESWMSSLKPRLLLWNATPLEQRVDVL